MWRAFDRLTTTRPRGFGLGPISYRDIVWYAQDMGFGPNDREFLWDVLRKVDVAYLRMVNEKLEAGRQKPPHHVPKG